MELLLDILKWSAIVGAAALALTLLKPLLDRRYSAKWRYGVWLVMAAFLLLAPVRWEALVPEAPVTPPVVIEVPKLEVSVSRQEGVSLQRPAVLPKTSYASAGTAVKKPAVFPLEEVLTGLWLAGAALFGLYYLVGTACFTRRARRWSRSAEEEALRSYEAVCREMGLKKAPPLRVSGAVDSPMVAGLFRPCLLLPGADFGERELTFILRHELTHYRRRDLWYKLALLGANALHWFNPLVWLMRREAERDLELTCDDAVVEDRDEMERRAYSEALLSSIHRQKGLSRAALSTHFYGGKEVMMERFRNILGKRGRKWGGLVLVLALLATVAAACAVGVKPSTDGELTAEELAAWQEKVESPEMDHYIWKMYSDVSYLPSEEKMEEMFPSDGPSVVLGHEDVNPKVLSGTKSGDTVTLELEGNFGSRLPSGTLTLVNEEPVSFTTPLYTAVETAARELMESAAEGFLSNAKEHAKELEFTEKYITNLFCSESMTFDGKTYYVWELYYVMKPNDIDNIVFAGDISVENGWLTTLVYPGTPILIFSVDADGKIVLEEQTWSDTMGEEGYTWEEYVYCNVHLGMGKGDIMNGWPELNTPFLESLRDGHDTWALDWQDVAISYLNEIYGIYADGGMDSLRTFKADETDNGHDQAVLAQAACGDRTVTLLLAQVAYPVEVWNTTIRFWQVCGEKWEPDRPQTVREQNTLPAGELTADELAAITDYFNEPLHNGLLRYPYSSLGQGTKYLELLFYDLGESVTDEAEREALSEAFYDGEFPDTDCLKLTRSFIQGYLEQNFGRMGNYGVEVDTSDLWLAFNALERSENIPYLAEYDAWYLVHGDTMMSNYTFDRAERDEEGVVSLYYTTDLWQYNDSGELDLLWDQPMRARMALGEDGGWRMMSNETVE